MIGLEPGQRYQRNTSGQGLAFLLCASVLLAACLASPTASPVSVQAARAELRDLITDVSASTAHRYRAMDDLGRDMGPLEVVWIPEASTFAGVYHTWSDTDDMFHLQVATSDNLLDWTWQVELARQASQPSIEAMSDGGYAVAWEQEPDPIHMVIASFASWADLRAGKVARRFDVPVTMPACGEGTPSIETASSKRVDLSFHYHAGCERDLQAHGSTDWTRWQATQRKDLDRALIDLDVVSHIGDRDSITFRGHELTLVEGQRVVGDWSSWRIFLYDEETKAAEELHFKTHAGSVSIGNPTIDQIDINGRAALLVTLYVFTEGSQGGEDGELIYYRYL